MPFCSVCGNQTAANAQFCSSCGRQMSTVEVPRTPVVRREITGFRTATLIISLFAATFLFIGGCSGYFFGAAAGAVEEAFNTEIVDSDSSTSTAEDVGNAGAFAMLVSFILFFGGSLARVALKTSLALQLIALLFVVVLVFIDSSSLFAIAYYFAVLATSVCVVLMFLAYRGASRNSGQTS